MIKVIQENLSNPITLQEVADYIGLADHANPVLGAILEGVIDDIEKTTGIGVGIHQVSVDVLPPVPSVLLLPFSPIVSITKIERYDPITLDSWEVTTNAYFRNTIPDQFWLDNSGFSSDPYGLIVTYTGGFEELPTEYRLSILRNCMARWENRQLKTLLDVIPVIDERYLKVWC